MKESLYAMVVIMILVMCIAVSCYVKQVEVAMPLTKSILVYDVVTQPVGRSKNGN